MANTRWACQTPDARTSCGHLKVTPERQAGLQPSWPQTLPSRSWGTSQANWRKDKRLSKKARLSRSPQKEGINQVRGPTVRGRSSLGQPHAGCPAEHKPRPTPTEEGSFHSGAANLTGGLCPESLGSCSIYILSYMWRANLAKPSAPHGSEQLTRCSTQRTTSGKTCLR